jgi:hypothetical protein
MHALRKRLAIACLLFAATASACDCGHNPTRAKSVNEDIFASSNAARTGGPAPRNAATTDDGRLPARDAATPAVFSRADPADASISSIVPGDRRTHWNPGLNSTGGIPRRTTICKTVAPSGGDDTASIQAAINGCPEDQVVQLAAGDFHINTGPVTLVSDPNAADARLRNGVNRITVRGAGSGSGGGTASTRLFLPTTGNTGPAFLIGTPGVGDAYFTQSANLVADALRGTTSVTVAEDPGYAIGELVVIDQTSDASISWFAPGHGNGGMFCRTNRPVGQVLEVQAIRGNTLTFSTPLHLDYHPSYGAQISRYWKGFGAPLRSPLHDSGIEDIYISGGAGGGGHIAMMRCKYCWIKNVESDSFIGPAIEMSGTFRGELRDSYIHSTRDPNPGGGGYAISVSWYGADNLMEDNISWNVNKVDVARSSGGGNVWGYNYFQDGFGANYPNIPESGMNASHYPTPHMELFEGNESWDAESDIVWGNSVYITFFRNHMTGRRISATPLKLTDALLRHAVGIGVHCKWFNFVGNVLGTPGMMADLRPQTMAVYEKDRSNMCDPSVFAVWMLGWGDTKGNCGAIEPDQAETASTALRHGNFDYVTNRIVWDPAITHRALPPSLYLPSKPAFFGTNPWPWVTPENAASQFATLPAKARFDKLH